MAYYGYFNYAGVEIINVARLRAYKENMHLPWLAVGYEDSEHIPAMLGEKYSLPWTDTEAPWYDTDTPNSMDFVGLYPLKVSGMEDSTRDAVVTESILDGGVVGRLRNGTRSIVFEAALLATSECGAEYGIEWLKQALNGRQETTCAGDSLCFFSCAPFYDPNTTVAEGAVDPIVYARWDGGYWLNGTDYSNDTPLDGGAYNETFTLGYDGGDPEATGGILTPPYEPPFLPEPVPVVPFDPSDCLVEFDRHFRNVAFTDGPTVTKKKELSNGHQVWTITFTAVAGVPFQFGTPITIIDGYLGPNSVWGVEGGMTSAETETVNDTLCAPVVWEPLVDPLCPALVAPPSVPEVDLSCFDPPDLWVRRWFTIPERQIPLWGDVVPVLEVAASFAEVRDLRVRFYTDDGSHEISETCSPLADLVFSYVPHTYKVVLDGEQRIIYADDNLGNQRRADTLVFASDGTPFDWPVLSCGDGIIVTVDVPEDSETVPEITLSLVSRGG